MKSEIDKGFKAAFPALLLSLMPATAVAEPGASGPHTPIMWLAAAAGAVLAGSLPLIIRKFTSPKRAAWPYWLVSVILALLFLIFAGPIIVAIGSILITGRTM
jgi:hypothetical protein